MAAAKKINTGTFQNDMTTFTSADDVMTLLVHLGYLGYDGEAGKKYSFPIMKSCRNTSMRRSKVMIGRLSVRLLKASDELLQAVFDGREADVASGVGAAHVETSQIQYNDEMLSVTPCPSLFTAPDGITTSFGKCRPVRDLLTWSLCRGRSMGINRLGC